MKKSLIATSLLLGSFAVPSFAGESNGYYLSIGGGFTNIQKVEGDTTISGTKYDLESDIVEETKPVKMIVSTMGGSAPEMFAVYDMMRHLRETCDLETLGLGKVMSAGVLLLAAGTKGKRKIGQNCRVMLHSVMGGYQGTLTHMENEIAEVRWMQDRYIKCLEAETNMCEREIKRMFKKHMDVYLSAEEAVEFGIADEIV